MSKPALIFNLDGVLVDSESIVETVFAEQLGRVGVQLTPDRSVRLQGLRLDDRLQLASPHGADLPSDLLDTLRAETLARLRTNLKPIPHIETTLASLPHRRCLVSSASPEQIALSLTVTGLDQFFPAEHRFSASQVQWGKPAPDLFQLAASEMGLQARDCMVIESSAAEVRGGKQARMPVLGFALGGHNQNALASAGAILFYDLRSLAAMAQAVWASASRARAGGVTCFQL